MEKEDRDRIFEHYGFKIREKDVCMGVSIWIPDAKHEETFIIAKHMGTWDFFKIVNAKNDVEALKNEEHGVNFTIESEEQLHTILKSLI